VQGWLQHWTQHTITQLLWVFPDNDYSNKSKWSRLLPHAQYALSHSLTDDDNEERLHLAWKCATALYSNGRYNEAEELLLRAVQTMKRVLGDKHPDTLTTVHTPAFSLQSQARHKETVALMGSCFSRARKFLASNTLIHSRHMMC
jgi:hypothetical protein